MWPNDALTGGNMNSAVYVCGWLAVEAGKDRRQCTCVGILISCSLCFCTFFFFFIAFVFFCTFPSSPSFHLFCPRFSISFPFLPIFFSLWMESRGSLDIGNAGPLLNINLTLCQAIGYKLRKEEAAVQQIPRKSRLFLDLVLESG